MNEPPKIETPERGRNAARAIRTGFIAVLTLFLLLFLLPIFAGSGLFETGGALLFGWLQFLRRTLPQISWNWDLIGMALLSSAIVIVLGQKLLAWGTRNIAAARGRDWKWRWKWTVCGLMAIGLCFLVGMSVGGVVHQAGWLSAQTESWYERKGEGYYDLRQLDLALQQAVHDTNGDVKEVRRALRDPESGYLYNRSRETPFLERFHLLLIMAENDTINGWIIFPRDFAQRPRSAGRYEFEGKNDHFEREALPALIKKHQKQLLAL